MIPVRRFPHGERKVLIHAYGDLLKKDNLERIAVYNRIDLYVLEDIRNRLFKDTVLYNMEWVEDALRRYGTHPLVQEIYTTVLSTVKKEKIDLFLWLGDPGLFTSSFLKRLRSECYTAFWTFDDPVNSEKIVRPVAPFFHQSFTATVNWSRQKKVTEVFKSWGSPSAHFIPIGVYQGKYKKVQQISPRRYDVIFVGSVFQRRLLFLFRLKRHFGERMLIFGKGWNGEGFSWYKKMILKVLKWYYKVPKIDSISDEELVDYYQNSKIGINTHMTEGGPSAVRTYELPANGVMQICDSEEGLKEIFRIGEEVVSYENDNASDAIEKIEYYLADEEKRAEIAEAGMVRTMKEYMVWHSFEKIFQYVWNDSRIEGARG